MDQPAAYNEGTTAEPEDSIIRVWDLDSNSTRYDVLQATPSDKDLRIMWIGISSVLYLVVLLTTLVLAGILTAPRKVKNNTFNTYLFYLVVPDFIFTAGCFTTCLMNAIKGEYFSDWMCQLQHFYLVFGIGANAWLNAVVAFQLYRLLRKSKFPMYKKQYRIPTPRDATRQSLSVYFVVAIIGACFFIPSDNDPMEIVYQKGMFCFAGETNVLSSVFFWVVFFPLVVGIPLLIVMWTYYQVTYYKMLPKTGRRRTLALFFTQLIVVFIIMWIPGLGFVFVAGGYGSPWLTWVGVIWSHLQGAAASICALLKPDINKAVKDLLLCRPPEEEKETYRVAVQSVSQILQGNDDPLPDKMSWNDQHILDDMEHHHYADHSHYGTSRHDDTEGGDPSARWPSQRPARVNFRLAQREREESLHRDSTEKSCTKSEKSFTKSEKSFTKSPSSGSRPKLASNRSVARGLLKALEDADTELGDERVLKETGRKSTGTNSTGSSTGL